MDIAVSNQVIARNNMGQFISACERAATETIRDAVNEGESLSKDFAPVGIKPDYRTVTLREGMYSEVVSRTAGNWGCAARHALPIEKGASAHVISGNPFLHFFWDSAGRWFVPGLFGPQDIVNHPGNAAQPYLRPAYEIVMTRVMQMADRHYPG